ncbi:unnamed protein product, partial [Meganyctiphanes norvegica]
VFSLQVLPVEAQHPYHRIHGLFNNHNYWANAKYDMPISRDMFDLTDADHWMPLYEVDPEENTFIEEPEAEEEKTQDRSEMTEGDELDADAEVYEEEENEEANEGFQLGLDGSPRADEPPMTVVISEPQPPQLSTPSITRNWTPKKKEKSSITSSWSVPIRLENEALQQRFPGGMKEETFRGVVVRRYAPFAHSRGVVLHITKFSQPNK